MSCSICCESFKWSTPVLLGHGAGESGHFFDPECIERWIYVNPHNPCCPLCRGRVEFIEKDNPNCPSIFRKGYKILWNISFRSHRVSFINCSDPERNDFYKAAVLGCGILIGFYGLKMAMQWPKHVLTTCIIGASILLFSSGWAGVSVFVDRPAKVEPLLRAMYVISILTTIGFTAVADIQTISSFAALTLGAAASTFLVSNVGFSESRKCVALGPMPNDFIFSNAIPDHFAVTNFCVLSVIAGAKLGLSHDVGLAMRTVLAISGSLLGVATIYGVSAVAGITWLMINWKQSND